MSDAVDGIVEERAEHGDGCGESLADCKTELDYITQTISLPELKPLITEVRHYVTICRTCGKRVNSAVQFLSYNRIASFFKEVFGLEVSQGSMVNCGLTRLRKLPHLPLKR